MKSLTKFFYIIHLIVLFSFLKTLASSDVQSYSSSEILNESIMLNTISNQKTTQFNAISELNYFNYPSVISGVDVFSNSHLSLIDLNIQFTTLPEQSKKTLIFPQSIQIPHSGALIEMNYTQQMESSKNNLFTVPVLLYSVQLDDSQALLLGRSFVNTSWIDKNLFLSAVHPLAHDQFINYEPQGLFGLQYRSKNLFLDNQHELKFIAGYFSLYLPSQEPTVDFVNDKAVIYSRWASKPPSTYIFNNQTKNVHYQLDDYSKNEILNNPSVFIGAQYKHKNISLNSGYKMGPMNQIALERDTYSDLTLDTFVKLKPVVKKTQIAFLDLVYDLNTNFQAGISTLVDQPDSYKSSDIGYINSDYSRLTASGVFLNYYTDSFYIFNNFKWQLSYSETFGGEIKDLNPDGKENVILVKPYRQLFFKPLKFSIGGSSSWGVTDVTYIYDSFQDGSLIQWQQKKNLTEKLSLNLGLGLLGSGAESSQSKNYFIPKFKSNDFFTTGVQYVF